MKLITTSWDDGHVLDFKLADLLTKYNLPATFYIPRANAERPVMEERQIKALSGTFEIGGHTLRHIRLASLTNRAAAEEIGGCHRWLSQLLGEAPASFCFPGGAYSAALLQRVFQTGFALARTTELFSTALPQRAAATATTLQAFPHSGLTYIKHLAKRRRWITLTDWLKSGGETDLCKLAENVLERMELSGGCFHLWGHSWEIEKYKLWTSLENLLKILANRPGFFYVQNRGLVNPPLSSFAEPALTTKKSEK